MYACGWWPHRRSHVQPFVGSVPFLSVLLVAVKSLSGDLLELNVFV